VFKEIDYATSLLTGPHKDSKLAEAFKAALNGAQPGRTTLTDFAPYLPSYEAPASFISAPVYVHDDFVGTTELKGVLIFQMPVDRINAVMQAKVGFNETGETILIGSDGLMRSQSRFLEETSIGKKAVDKSISEHALAGESDVAHVVDETGNAMISAFAPVVSPDPRCARSTRTTPSSSAA